MEEYFNISISKINFLNGNEIDQNLFSQFTIFNKDHKVAKYGIIGNIIQKDDMHYDTAIGKRTMARTTPLFDEMKICTKSKNPLYVFGRIGNQWAIYKLENMDYFYYSKKPCCTKYEFDGKFKNYEIVDEETYIIKTDKGSFLFNIEEMKRTSDIYDYITSINEQYPPYYPVFYNDMNIGDYNLRISGSISSKGKLSSKIYCDCPTAYFNTPLLKTDKEYDVLDKLRILKVLINKLISSQDEKTNSK